jgi:predicted RNA polymerase sigma factor
LLSLLCFHAARLSGRMDDGVLLQLETQDRSTWDKELIARGFHFLSLASTGTALSEFHLEAAIASLHCAAPTYEQTEWSKIVEAYDGLYRLKPTPIVALSRAVAVGKAQGPDAGLEELRKISEADTLDDYPFYPAAQGEFLLAAGRPKEAKKYFNDALRRARTPTERNYFESKIRK